MIGYYGIAALKYKDQSLGVDIALIILACFILFSSVICIYGAYKQKFRFLLFVLYLNTLLFSYIVVCIVGIVTFKPDYEKYIKDNWTEFYK